MAGFLLAALAAPVSAADQGSLGAASSGSLSISASVAPQLQASGLPDMMASRDEASLCVWINTATHRYDLISDGALSWSAGPDAARDAGQPRDGAVSDAKAPGCRNDDAARARLARTGSPTPTGSTTLIVSPQ
jgi:hypothetical protein